LTAGRTTIAIAHRLSTAARADLVLVIDRGRLVEVGTHASLVDGGGVYAHLHERWLDVTGAIATSNRGRVGSDGAQAGG
jgi:ABC-type multidrug transport system fused ATPase/permease subunit